MEIRCPNGVLHGIIDPESGTFETTCKSRWCGKVPGTTVIHRFSLETGKLISTRSYKDPTTQERK